ncbi:phage tail protein [Streptomyces sp. SKN60]|uniref:phage tail protein n=1 Tax=Streptomyces sp. SKN60 TaxID=2855506 RepID=UPI002247CD8B|nr:phage tail protein [Streptomyces sp. SKN60]MCX2183915.1 phage tail protein [Streptomyces sp. SKN60]
MLPVTAPQARPYLAAHFVLAVEGLSAVSFSKCSGLAGEVGVEEYAEGGENRFAHRLPTRASFPNLVLTQGTGPSTELWSWFFEYHTTGKVRPRAGQVSLLSHVDGAMVPVRVWAFRRAWPVKLTGPDLDAQASAVAVESLELAHHGLVLAPVGV